MSFDETDPNRTSLDVYKDHFETPFITATEEYYKLESEAFLGVNSIYDYLKRAEERLREEEDRGARDLNPSTHKIVRVY